MLGLDTLAGLTFLDIGCGSGLFSLAARRLGATVYSFDYDPQSVACSRQLKERYLPDDAHWHIEWGSVLDAAYLESLPRFDIVYSWGVLHHTGAMWQALDHAQRAVAPNGKLFIAIYNDMGSQSIRWRQLKRLYAKLPAAIQPLYACAVSAPEEAKGFLLASRIRGDGRGGSADLPIADLYTRGTGRDPAGRRCAPGQPARSSALQRVSRHGTSRRPNDERQRAPDISAGR